MITVTSRFGRGIDPERYRAALMISSPEEKLIRKGYVATREQMMIRAYNEVQKSNDGTLMRASWREFLRAFTYTQNLLTVPYEISPVAVAILNVARTFEPLRCRFDVNKGTYYREKMLRAGVPEAALSNIERDLVLSEESRLWENREYLNLVKLFGRYRGLGLSSSLSSGQHTILEEDVKYWTQETLYSTRICLISLLCSAQRADLILPPLKEAEVDQHLEKLNQKRQQVQRVLELQDLEATPPDISDFLPQFVSDLHHFRRLLLNER